MLMSDIQYKTTHIPNICKYKMQMGSMDCIYIAVQIQTSGEIYKKKYAFKNCVCPKSWLYIFCQKHYVWPSSHLNCREKQFYCNEFQRCSLKPVILQMTVALFLWLVYMCFVYWTESETRQKTKPVFTLTKLFQDSLSFRIVRNLRISKNNMYFCHSKKQVNSIRIV